MAEERKTNKKKTERERQRERRAGIIYFFAIIS